MLQFLKYEYWLLCYIIVLYIEEASPFITLRIVREYPSGTQEADKEIRTGSNIQVYTAHFMWFYF